MNLQEQHERYAKHLLSPPLATLLRRARPYVEESLEAHEHSDGRKLLKAIDAALSSSSGG